MLIRLTPEQIVEVWHKIRPLLLEHLIPKVNLTPEAVFGCLQALLTEKLQLWAGVEPGEGDISERVFGFVATMIDVEAISKSKNLLLYSLFAVKSIPIEMWEKGIGVLEEYKEINGCKSIIAYTDLPEIKALAKKLGFKNRTFLIKE